MLIEIVSEDFCKGCFTRTRLTYNHSIDRDTNIHDILTRTEIGISIDYRLELPLHFVESHKFIKQVLTDKWFSTPLTELGDTPVFLMTVLTYHYSTSLSNCFIISVGEILFTSGLSTFIRVGLKMIKFSTNISAKTLHRI